MGDRNVFARLRSKLLPRPRPCILMYHRIADVVHDPWNICVGPERFVEQIAFLKKHRSPMSMTDLFEGLRRGNLPADAVAVTFDDGYCDNLVHAKPALAEHRVPATVFVATGCVGHATFWWDELASFCLKYPGPLQYVQILGTDPVTFHWGDPEPADSDHSWKGWDAPRTSRQAAYAASWKKLLHTPSTARAEWMARLRERFPQPPEPLAAPMMADEVRELVVGGLIAVEAHTVTHAALTLLSTEERCAEIKNSAQDCASLTGRPSQGLAYPYGRCDSAVCRDAELSGFSWACSTQHGFLDAGPLDLYALPRITVTNLPLAAFARLLQG